MVFFCQIFVNLVLISMIALLNSKYQIHIRVCKTENDCKVTPGVTHHDLTKCNTNCYIRIYKNTNGEQIALRGCNDGNELPKDLKNFTIQSW